MKSRRAETAKRTKGVSYRLVLLGLLVLASVAWISALWIFEPGEAGVRQHVASSPEPSSAEPAPAGADSGKGDSGEGDYRLRSGESMWISAAALPRNRPVELDLVLAEPSAAARPLTLHIVDGTGRELELRANPKGSDMMSAGLKLDSGWLRPGFYVIHLRTTERTPLPLRRYGFEVR